MNNRNSKLSELTIDFSVDIIHYCKKLENQKEFVIAKQLLKSATSIGANIFEAQFAESRPDFIHKLKISAKEAKEAEYWLKICTKVEIIPNHDLEDKLLIIQKIITKSISSCKNNSILKRN